MTVTVILRAIHVPTLRCIAVSITDGTEQKYLLKNLIIGIIH